MNETRILIDHHMLEHLVAGGEVRLIKPDHGWLGWARGPQLITLALADVGWDRITSMITRLNLGSLESQLGVTLACDGEDGHRIHMINLRRCMR